MPDQGNPYLDPNFQKELDDLLKLYGENQRNRLKTVTPAPVEPTPPAETWANKFARYGHRAGEILGEFGHTALELPTLLGKLPANIEEWTGRTPDPVSAKLREASRWLENKSAAGLQYMREGVKEHGGTPLEESKVDTHIPLLDEVSLATPLQFAGTVAAPAPGLPAIPKLLSKAAIKPAVEGTAKLGTYGAGLSAAAEVDKPEEQRDWWNVPKGAALGLTAPLLQRGMGALATKPLPPGAEGSPGVTHPPSGGPSGLRVHLPDEEPTLPLGHGAPEPYRPLEPGPPPELTHPAGEMPQHVLPLEESFPPVSRVLHGQPEKPIESEPFHVEQEVKTEMPQREAEYNHVSDLLNNERGSINLTLGQGVGPIQKILTARRVSELHPQDFKPVYDHMQQRFEFVNSQKYDLNKLAEPFFLASEADRAKISDIMRQRRRLGAGVSIPAQYQPIVNSLDTMFKSAADLINSVREAKGLPDMALEDFYVPFSRSGDYLVVMEGPKGTVPRWVSATETLREGEALAKSLQTKHPQATITVKSSSGQKGDKPALDFGTLGMLQKAGLLGPDEYEKAIKQFGLPMGFSEHFQKALKTFGEATDITDPISRYIDGVTNYAGRALYDDTTKQLVSKITDPQVRQYAEKYHQYINEKPVEFSRLRGATAVYDLALNVGSMVQNASQVPVMGLPVLQSYVGSVTKAANLLRKGFTDVLHPDRPVTIGTHTYKPKDLLEMWTRSGDVRPINAQELFGVVKGEQTGLELGSPTIQRMAERGALSPAMAGRIRRPIDFLAGGLEKGYDKFQHINQTLGQQMSYGMSRITGKTPKEATQKATQAHGILMQGFAWMEEKNRAMALLSGYRAGLEKGQTPQQAFEFARTFSRNVNFDYSPASRAQYFRGMGAPLGLFMTFQTEALATYSKLLKAQIKNPGLQKLYGPATTAVLAYMTLGGMKGLPGPLAGFPSMEDIDMYGPKPGAISEHLPDWLWHGPASAVTGTDVGSKFKLGARVPFRMGDQGPEFDPSQVAVAQPWYNLGKAATTLGNSPGDVSDWWRFGEGISPPAIRSPIAAARWAGFGPAGELERGAVGTVRGHTPGPTEEGKREFFIPSPKDIAGKALTFTPLELSKQYARGRIESQYRDEEQGLTTETVNAAARHLQKNGPTVPNVNLRTLASEHPNTYRELMKAYGIWQKSPHGSVEQIYRSMQEPKKPAKR